MSSSNTNGNKFGAHQHNMVLLMNKDLLMDMLVYVLHVMEALKWQQQMKSYGDHPYFISGIASLVLIRTIVYVHVGVLVEPAVFCKPTR